MEFEPVVERCAEGEEHFARGGLAGDTDDESDIEEIEAEARPRSAAQGAGSDSSAESFQSREQPEASEEGQDVFFCPLCSRHAPLHEVVPMPACPCLFCKSCIQAFVGRELGSLQAEPGDGGWEIGCPTQACRGKLMAADCQALAPEAFARWCEAASETLLEEDDTFIHCLNPECGIPIEKLGYAPLPFGLELTGVPELDRTAPFLERSPSGTPLSRQALVHRAKFLYRCGKCCTDFCGGCLTAPYHLGISCKENITQQHARRCRFCDSLCGEALDTSSLLARPVKMLRRESEQERVDTSWCIEKAELVEVLLWAASVCPDQACRQRLEKSCTRMLPCGHHCGGVRGERECLPCLESPCREPHGRPHPAGALPRADDDCSICFVDSLRQGPAIRLECGHVVHFQCAEKKIAAGYPGPAISFGFLRCPLCSERMRHPSLHKVLAPALTLEAQVRERGRARFRLTLDQRQRRRAAASKGADAGEEAAALAQYQFYLCSRCKVPYYGGERRCAPAFEGPAENVFRADELVCGGCLAGSKGLCKRGHGRDFIEYKCRFCCSVATFFCFGHTHFCDDCHSSRPDRNPGLVKPCPGATRCKLGVEHPRQGEEYCLGCAACRSTGQ